MVDSLRLADNTYGTVYVPEYLATALGFFAEQDLEVVREVPHPGELPVYLSSGRADIAQGGIWRSLMYRNRLETMISFARLNTRNPLILMARAHVADFGWTALQGKSVVVPTGAPSPWMFMLGLMRRAKVDFGRVQVIHDFEAPEALKLFRAGLGDYCLVPPSVSEELLDEGFHIAVTMAQAGGMVPWTVYYTTPEFLDHNGPILTRFTRAIRLALRWVLSNPPEQSAEVLRSYFPDLDPSHVARAIRRACVEGVWTEDIRVSEPDVLRYQEMMLEYGLFQRPLSFAQIFDGRVADIVMRERGVTNPAKAIRWGVSEMGLLLTIDGRDCPGCDSPQRFCWGTRTEIALPAGLRVDDLLARIGQDFGRSPAFGRVSDGAFYLDPAQLAGANAGTALNTAVGELLRATGNALRGMGAQLDVNAGLAVADRVLRD